VLLVSLQQRQFQMQQRAAILLRGIAISTTAFISYLGSFAAQLRSSSSSSSSSSNNSSSNSNSSNSSSSTQIINGLNKHSWIFLLIYLNLSAKGECHSNYLECCMQQQLWQQQQQQQQQQHNAPRQHIVTLTHKTTQGWGYFEGWAAPAVIVVCQL